MEPCRAAGELLFGRKREKKRHYSLDDILKGSDVGVLQLGEIALDVVVEIDLNSQGESEGS